MNADDLGSLMAANGISGNHSPSGSSPSRGDEGFNRNESPDTDVSKASSGRSTGVFNSSSSASGSVASGRGGLQRMPSRSSSSSSGGIKVMRSADLAYLMSGLDLGSTAQQAGTQNTQTILGSKLVPNDRSSGLSLSGDGLGFGGMAAVATTWRAADVNEGGSDGTMTYSDDSLDQQKHTAPSASQHAALPPTHLLGPPQPAYRPLPSSASFRSGHQVSGYGIRC